MVILMKTNKITALYCRISREGELIQESPSIETQKAYLSRYASTNKLYNIKYYTDDGYSGSNFDRPGFMELKKKDITQFIEKLIILEKRNKHKKRIVNVYYTLIGLV